MLSGSLIGGTYCFDLVELHLSIIVMLTLLGAIQSLVEIVEVSAGDICSKQY